MLHAFGVSERNMCSHYAQGVGVDPAPHTRAHTSPMATAAYLGHHALRVQRTTAAAQHRHQQFLRCLQLDGLEVEVWGLGLDELVSRSNSNFRPDSVFGPTA